MTAFLNLSHIVGLYQSATSFPCAFCWSRGSTQTFMRDESGNPICAACAENPRRRRTMPSFVVRSIKEASHEH